MAHYTSPYYFSYTHIETRPIQYNVNLIMIKIWQTLVLKQYCIAFNANKHSSLATNVYSRAPSKTRWITFHYFSPFQLLVSLLTPECKFDTKAPLLMTVRWKHFNSLINKDQQEIVFTRHPNIYSSLFHNCMLGVNTAIIFDTRWTILYI